LAGKKTESMPESIMVLGLKYKPPNANVDFWRMERFALPEALVGDRFIRTEIRQLLTIAEETQKSLWAACSSFARDSLSRGSRKPSADDIKRFVRQMPIIASYWSTLESRFHEILQKYSLDQDFEDIRCQWLKSVRKTLQEAWEQHRITACIGDVWAIRALVKAEGLVRRKVQELDDEILKLEPKKEGA
jgi:CRISPR system Cascade subunit CasA